MTPSQAFSRSLGMHSACQPFPSHTTSCFACFMADGGGVQESVADILGRLSFVSSSAPAIYLNERLANELFLAQLGSIGTFTRAAARRVEGKAGPAVVQVGASKDLSQQVTYELNDALTKALILHSALGGVEALVATGASSPGAFAEAIGPTHLPPVARVEPAPPEAVMDVVSAEAERQRDVLRGFGNAETVLMPLLLLDRRGPVGSVINRKWVRQEWAASYLPLPQVGFGIIERVVEGLPLMTLMYMRAYL